MLTPGDEAVKCFIQNIFKNSAKKQFFHFGVVTLVTPPSIWCLRIVFLRLGSRGGAFLRGPSSGTGPLP